MCGANDCSKRVALCKLGEIQFRCALEWFAAIVNELLDLCILCEHEQRVSCLLAGFERLESKLLVSTDCEIVASFSDGTLFHVRSEVVQRSAVALDDGESVEGALAAKQRFALNQRWKVSSKIRSSDVRRRLNAKRFEAETHGGALWIDGEIELKL